MKRILHFISLLIVTFIEQHMMSRVQLLRSTMDKDTPRTSARITQTQVKTHLPYDPQPILMRIVCHDIDVDAGMKLKQG